MPLPFRLRISRILRKIPTGLKEFILGGIIAFVLVKILFRLGIFN
jgi:hypothetical protein